MPGNDDPFAPPSGTFSEPWQATVLAVADAMVCAGHFSANAWAEALGQELSEAEETGAPDTETTYFLSALTALERLCQDAGIDAEAQDSRKSDWEAAYRRTPHGKPVLLEP